MSEPEKGPCYGVDLIDTLPLGNGTMTQAMPSRADLDKVREISERTVAGYEVLLDHYRYKCEQLERITEATEACSECGFKDVVCQECGAQP